MKGYKGICTESGKYVGAENALSYAMQQCGIQIVERTGETQAFEKMLVEWFFSGNWIEENCYELHI